MAFAGQNVSFDWLANLPKDWEEAQAMAAQKRSLANIDVNDPKAIERAAAGVFSTNPQLGIALTGLAQKQRDQLQTQQSQEMGMRLLGGGNLPPPGPPNDPRGLVPYIKQKAQEYGIDPEVAVRVAQSEGLSNPVGDEGKSFGAFQLYTGGGLGNEFIKDTKLNPADPNNEKATIDYALKRASQEGWGPWNGAKAIGLGQWTGIGGQKVAQAAPTMEAAAAGQSPEMRSIQSDLDKLGIAAGLPKQDPGMRAVLLEKFKAKLAESSLTPEMKNWFSVNADNAIRGQPQIPLQEFLGKEQEGVKAYRTKSAEMYLNDFKTYNDLGNKADNTMATLRRAKSLASQPDFVSGPGVEKYAMPVAQAGSAMLTALGIDAGPYKTLAEKTKNAAANWEQFKTLAQQSVLSQTGGSLGNQISNSDRDFMLSSVFNLNFTKEGNLAIIDAMHEVANFQKQLQKVAIEYRKKYGDKGSDVGLAEAVNKYKEEHPIFVDEKTMRPTELGQKILSLQPQQVAPQQAAPAASSRTIRPEDEGRSVIGPGGKQFIIRNGVPVPAGGT